jgi:hypothetical protein
VELECRPQLVNGIGHWELFPGMFIIGNVELDRYMRVPAESIEPVWQAIQYCDGNRSLSEVAELILADGWRIDASEFYRKLNDAGLVAESTYTSDLDRLLVTWFEVRINGLFPPWRWWHLWAHLLTAAMIASPVVAGVIWFMAPVTEAGIWSPSETEFAAAMFSGVVISILLHEAGHALAACAEGLTPDRIRLSGYLAVIPYTILRIPGLYTIRRAGRVRVWLAGPLASLALGSVSYLGSGIQALPLFARVWLDHMSVANVMLALLNCCPLLPTDGYFVASTLLKQANWRIRSWRELTSCIRERRRPQILLFVYALGSLLVLANAAFRSVNRILESANFSWFGYAGLLLLILPFGLKRWVLRRRTPAMS